MDREAIWQLIKRELDRQNAKWGEQSHPSGTGGPYEKLELRDWRAQMQRIERTPGLLNWRHILKEEFLEAMAEEPGSEDLEKELVETAAVAVQWILSERRKARKAAQK